MKFFIVLLVLTSLSAFASTSGELMASCQGSLDGVETKLNIYLDSNVYCEQSYSGPYKGYILIEDELMSSVTEAKINYQPGNYSAVIQFGANFKLEVLFPNFDVPGTVNATINVEDEGHSSTSAMTCRLPEYHIDC